jgi:hypothetical protein
MTFRHLLVDAFMPPESSEPHYWFETRKPFCNLVFLLPLLLAYELGVLLIGGAESDSFRNGADAWMRQFLLHLGIDLIWILPFSLIAALLLWQWASRQPWRTSWDTLGGMIAESLLFAFALILMGQAVDSCFRQSPANLLVVEGTSWVSTVPDSGDLCRIPRSLDSASLVDGCHDRDDQPRLFTGALPWLA